MNALDDGVPGLLGWLYVSAFEIAVLVIAVWLVQRVLGRFLAPRWRYGLWLVVLARLLVPVSPESRFALPCFGLPHPLSAPMAGPTLGPAARASDLAARRELFEPPDFGPGFAQGASAVLEPPRPAIPAGERAQPEAHSTALLGWRAAVVLLWLAGALAMLGVALVREIAFRRRLAGERLTVDARARALLEACRAEAGLSREIRLVATELVPAPAVMGILAPRVLLPRHLVESASEEELRRYFRHELAHVRHADVVLALVVLVARALWWFHPLAHLALARLALEQELARDFEALARERSPAPLAYAGALVRVVEQGSTARAPVHAALLIGGGSDLQRRITMITRFDGSLSRGRALALALVAVLGWGAFTSASPREPGSSASAPPATPMDRTLALSSASDADPLAGAAPDDVRAAQIVVERHQEPPAWLVAAHRALETRIGPLSLAENALPEAITFLATAAGLEAAMSSEIESEYEGSRLSLAAGIVTVREGLDIVCGAFGANLGWCLREGAVVVGNRMDLPYPVELRLYRVDRLLEGEDSGSLENLILGFTGSGGAWERIGSSIQHWNGVFAIVQTVEIHAEVQTLLERLLARAGSPAAPAQQDAALLAKLAQAPNVSLAGLTLHEAALLLAKKHGVPLVHPLARSDETIEGEIEGKSVAAVVKGMADFFGLFVRQPHGLVVLSESPLAELAIYDVSDLIQRAQESDERDGGDIADELSELLRSTVDPASWELSGGFDVSYWNGMFVVSQTHETQARVAAFLDSMRRALGR
jgi:beta-lactamase regulating signal transducer with metallopeptidase domain